MIDADQLTNRYFECIGVPNEASQNDPFHHAHLTFLRNMIRSLAEILDIEAIPVWTAKRIVSRLLFGVAAEEDGPGHLEHMKALCQQAASAEMITQDAAIRAIFGAATVTEAEARKLFGLEGSGS